MFFMTHLEYTEDIARCARISSLLRERMDEVFHIRLKAAPIFATLTGLRERSAYAQICHYVNGHFVSQVSPNSTMTKPFHLERLALFYEMIGVPADDPVVALTKEVNPHFAYPPVRDMPEESCHITVTFDRPNVCLTDVQQGHLERLALLYARRNLGR